MKRLTLILLLLSSPALAIEQCQCSQYYTYESKELCTQLCELNEKLDKVYVALESHKQSIDTIQRNEAYINDVMQKAMEDVK